MFGCGRNSKAPPGKTLLTFNTHWAGRDAHAVAMEWVYTEFAKKYPKYYLDALRLAGGYADMGQKLMAELAAGGGPDIIHDTTYDHVRTGYLLDLTEHIAPWKDRFYPDALESCTWDGCVYSLPTEYSYVPCIWNMAPLDKVGKKVPETFEEYMDVGYALKAKGINLTSLSSTGHHIFFSIAFGYPNTNELIAKKDWKCDPFRKSMEVIKKIIDAGFLPSNDAELFTTAGSTTLFQTDRLGHYMNGAWTIINEITAPGVDPDLRNRTVFTAFPEFDGHRPMRAWVATRSALNNNLKSNKDKLRGALAFCELLTSKESARRFVSMAHSPQGVKVDVTEEMAGPLLYKFIKARDAADRVYVFPNNPGYFGEQVSVRSIPDAFISMLEGGSLENAMNVFAEGMNL